MESVQRDPVEDRTSAIDNSLSYSFYLESRNVHGMKTEEQRMDIFWDLLIFLHANCIVSISGE